MSLASSAVVCILPPVFDEPLPSLRGVRVLITGATGFIGQWVVHALQAQHADVAIVARNVERLESVAGFSPTSVQVLSADLAVPGQLTLALQSWSPAVVFHLAGYGVSKSERDSVLMQRMNTDVLFELVDGLAQISTPLWHGQRLVHAGSAFEYGSTMPLDEAAVAAPLTPYGYSKLAGTQLLLREARARGLAAVVGRLFTVFGPGERAGRLFPTLLAAMSSQEEIALSSGTQTRDFTLVWDVASALVEFARLPSQVSIEGRAPLDVGIVNVASGRLHSVRAFVEAAATAFGISHNRLCFGQIAQMAEDVAMLPVPVGRLQSAIKTEVSGNLEEMFARLRSWQMQSE